PHRRRPGRGGGAALPQARGALLRARGHLHDGGRRAPQARLEGAGARGARRRARAAARVRGRRMNPRLALLQPYPFEKLRKLFEGVTPPAGLAPISLGIGEPRHPTPALVKSALTDSLSKLAVYPATAGGEELRRAIAEWIGRRYEVPVPDWK